MITCFLQGGLGNQMFQIAATTALALTNDDIPVFNTDTHHWLMRGRKGENYVDSIFSKLLFDNKFQSQDIYEEPYFHFKKIPYIKNICLKGYFQSEKYFKYREQEIRELFSPTKEIDNYLQKKYGSILKLDLVSLHVRRGDYLNLSDHHPVCTLEYYNQAMKLFSDVTYLVFSDDILWCKMNLPLENKYIFIEDNKDYEDLYLMSMCEHAIIANSSFSWWGAWLNQNPNKIVVAPKKWFGNRAPQKWKDLYCKGWTVI